MNARERLRLYLEQRRELGEQELVLDRLDVDDVLRMVGALGKASAGAEAAPAPRRLPPPDERADAKRTGQPAQARRDSPTAPESRSAAERPAQELTATPGDWRETLRAAGGGPPGLATGASSVGPAIPDDESPGAPEREVTGMPTPTAPVGGSTRTSQSAGSGTGDVAAASSLPVLPAWVAGLGVPAGLSVGKSSTLEASFAGLRSLEELARATETCTRCSLYRTATHSVPGEGSPHANLVCVGEAPGANEDATGQPFVGAAGQLLTKILSAINLSREDVFICNVLKHRPPGNRNPTPDEVTACSPYLLRQLELVRPRVILTLGTFAAQTLLATKTPLGKLRDQVHLYHGIPLVVTYHPAALLRNSAWKRPTWEDVQLARRLLDSAPSSS